MPLTSSVGQNIRTLKAENKKKKRSQKQILAIALDAARRAGAKIKKPKGR